MSANLKDGFISAVAQAGHLVQEDRVSHFVDWLRNTSLEDIKAECRRQAGQDILALARNLTPNPPAVLELAFYGGYALQLLYWFPIAALDKYKSYDTEDIHSHFGTIVTKGLLGTSYQSHIYERSDSSVLREIRQKDLREGQLDVITSDVVHSVKHQDGRVALSARVVFPYDTPYMDTFDSETLHFKEKIWCGSDQKMVELSGVLTALGLDECVGSATTSIKALEGLQEVARLKALRVIAD